MNTKHTPGPWHVGISTATEATKEGDKFLGIGTDNGAHICRITRLDKLIEQDEVDAQLIAAAPDLLEACQFILRVHKENRGDCLTDALDMIEDAIAKATGEE